MGQTIGWTEPSGLTFMTKVVPAGLPSLFQSLWRLAARHVIGFEEYGPVDVDQFLAEFGLNEAIKLFSGRPIAFP